MYIIRVLRSYCGNNTNNQVVGKDFPGRLPYVKFVYHTITNQYTDRYIVGSRKVHIVV